MKKLLGIVVLGLMLSGNAYADRLGIGEKRLDINFSINTSKQRNGLVVKLVDTKELKAEG